MNADEKQIYELLGDYGDVFVSVNEISKRLGHGRRYDSDRTWARPVLRRMEMDKLVESNPFGEYRILRKEAETDHFKKALDVPGICLGDTTIIRIEDVRD